MSVINGLVMFSIGFTGLVSAAMVFIAILCLDGTRRQLWGSGIIAIVSIVIINYGVSILLQTGY